MLVVLAEDEFTEGADAAERPLPYINISDATVLPAADQLWAWAHVHVNRTLAAGDAEMISTDMRAVLPRLQALLDEDPDLAYSRIVCPRRLAEDTGYHAFLVPVFKTGRLAGLGHDPRRAPDATFSAWAADPAKAEPEPASLPFYHRWYFRTAARGDFEYLIRLLERTPVDKRVGTRDMDVSRPAPDLAGITDPELGGILRLGGALRVPRSSFNPDELAEIDRYENWEQPYPHRFQEALAILVNLADDYAGTPPAEVHRSADVGRHLGPDVARDPDPIVTAPLYGRWHALTRRLLRDRSGARVPLDRNWLHDVNLDPRHRVAAGLGTRIVQKFQEEYMSAAWEQVGDLRAANRRIRSAQLAREVSWIWYSRHLLPLATASRDRALALTAPTHRHIVTSGLTVHHQRLASRLPPVVTSAAMRRITRPRARLMRALPFDVDKRPDNLLARINDGEVSAAPPKTTPPAIRTIDELADELLARGVPKRVAGVLRRFPWLAYVPLLLLVLILLLALLRPRALRLLFAAAAAAGLVAAYRVLHTWSRVVRGSDVAREANLTPEAVDALPHSQDFRLSEPGSGFTPRLDGTDSAEAARFKAALRDWHDLYAASAAAAATPAPARLELDELVRSAVAALDPRATIPRRTLTSIGLPARIVDRVGETFQEVMAYPRIDIPMYKPLAEISSELLLPNLGLVPQNSVTLLEPNHAFIEAYMVGLNHEFARELLWRGYPTDQRGSYFRQFWDNRSFFDSESLSDEDLEEKLRDIPELHRWPPDADLGDNDHRGVSGTTAHQLVLLVRGELLKKYPTAVVYAHRASWQTTGGAIDPSKPRTLEELVPDEEASPPRRKVRTPLYHANVEPDVYFLGFDLTEAQVRGGTGEDADDEPGWFFVIKERPGEPRFGLDIASGGRVETFDDLGWDDALPGSRTGDYLQATSLDTIALAAPVDAAKRSQHEEDTQVAATPASAARWAYILYQAPAMVAIHGTELLRDA